MYSIILSYLIFTSGTAGLTDYLSLYRIITVVNMYSIILSYLIFASGTAGLTDYLSLYRIITVVNMLLQPHPGPTVNLYNKINLFNSIGVNVSSFLYKYIKNINAGIPFTLGGNFVK